MIKHKVKSKQHAIMAIILIAAIIASILLIIFPPFALTGAFSAGGVSWENKLVIPADSGQTAIRTHIIFGQYKTASCADSVYVEINGQSVPFKVENDVIAGGLCKETDIIFNNIIYVTEGNFQIPENSITAYSIYYGKISEPSTTMQLEQPNFGVSANTYIVNTTTPACTTGTNYYSTISAAVSAASAGDSIVVCPGTYTEYQIITKSLDISSYSQNPADTHVITSISVRDTFNVTNANYFNLSGFNITGDPLSVNRNSVYLLNSNNSHIFNNILDYGGYANIFLESSSFANVTNNIVYSSAHPGIYVVTKSNNNNITNNTVYNNNYNGIYIMDSSSSNWIINNTVRNNYPYGIYIHSSHNNMLINNTASNNTEWDYYSSNDASSNTVINLTTKQNTISFVDNGEIALSGMNSTQAPSDSGSGYHNIGKWVNATNNSADGWLSLNISYTQTNLDNFHVNESTLFIARNNGTWETDTGQFANNPGVAIGSYYVYANITNFSSTFAPLGELQSHTDVSGCINIASGGLYLLNANLEGNQSNGRCIDIQANNVLLDCLNTYSITGNESGTTYGIYTNSTNTTVQNCIITNYTTGIHISSSSNHSTITSNNVSSNYRGIDLQGADLNNITNNSVIDNTYGILLDTSCDLNNILNNTASSNGVGIVLDSSSNNTIANNTANDNTAFQKGGIILQTNSNYNVLDNNTLHNNYYYGISLTSSSNNNLTNNNINNTNYTAVYIDHNSNNIRAINNTASYSVLENGFEIRSSNNTFSNNTANNNNVYGFFMADATGNNNIIINNTASGNDADIFTSSATNNTVTNLTTQQNVVSFMSKRITLKGLTPAQAPSDSGSGYHNISRWINATNNSADSWLFLNVSYNETEVTNLNLSEATLFMARKNNTAWETNTSKFAVAGAFGVDNTSKYVYANITSFGSTFAPLGESPPALLPTNVSGCMNLTQVNTTYILNQSISGNQSSGICIDIQADNVLLDCINYSNSITGPNQNYTYGISTNSSNTTIKNCNVSTYQYSIYLNSSNNSTITSNMLNDAYWQGFYLYHSNYNIINNNTCSDNTNGLGIGLQASLHNNITNNNFTNNYDGLWVGEGSNYNNFINNNINYSNESGFALVFNSGYNNIINNSITNQINYGFRIYQSSNNTFTNNKVSNSSEPGLFSSGDISSEDSENNTFINQTIGLDYPTSFNATCSGNISMKGAISPPPDPTSYTNISKYINATNWTAGAWLFLNISYDNSTIGVPESSLFMARNNGTWETNTSKFANTYNVDTTNHYVYANITNFGSTFAPLGGILGNTAPSIILHYPTEGLQINNTQTVTFNFTATDDLNLTLSCDIYLDDIYNQTNATTQNNTVTDFTINGISYGSHNWTINCTDGLLSNVSETRNFTIADTLSPVVTIIPPTPDNNSYINYSSPTINASVVNGVSAIDVCTLEFDLNNDAMTKVGSGSSVTCYNDTTGLSEGPHNFTVYANDTAGNTGSNGTWFFTVDTINPSIYYNPPTTSAGNYSQDWIFINVTCADPNRDTVILNWNGTIESFDNNLIDSFWENKTSLGDGTYNFYAWCNDSATNSNQTAPITVMLDTTYPQIQFATPTTESLSGIFVNRSWIAANVSIDELNLQNFTYYLYNTTDLVSSDTFATYPTDINWTIGLSDGSYYYNTTVYDLAGNYNYTETRNITLDNINPDIQFVYPTPNNNNNVTGAKPINVTASDTNLANITIYMNDTLVNNCSAIGTTLDCNFTFDSTLFANDSIQNFSAIATDYAGNTNTTGYNIYKVDNVPPTVNLISPPTPPNLSYTNISIIQINSTVYDSSGVSACVLNFDGTNIDAIYSPTDSCNFTVGPLNEGMHNFTLIVNDSTDPVNVTGPIFFTVDTTYPEIQFVSITETSGAIFNRTNIQVNVTANDTNLANITINLYNSTDFVNSTNISSSGNLFVNFTNLPDEIYYFNATAIDLALNTNSTETRNVTIDTINPLIQFVSPTPSDGAKITTKQASQTLNVSHTELHPDTIKLFIDNILAENKTYSGNYTNFSVTFSLGTHVYRVELNDTAGNFNSTENRTITVKKAEEEGGSTSSTQTAIYNCGIGIGQNAVFKLRVGDSIDCIINGKLHSVRLAEILDEKQLAEFEIASPLRIAVGVNQTYEADVDENGFNDTAIKLLAFEFPRTATIRLSLLQEAAPAPVVQPPVQPTKPTTPTYKRPITEVAAPPYALLGIMILLVLIIISVGYRYYGRRIPSFPAVPKFEAELPKPPAKGFAAPPVTELQRKVEAIRQQLEVPLPTITLKAPKETIAPKTTVKPAKPVKRAAPEKKVSEKKFYKTLRDVEKKLK